MGIHAENRPSVWCAFALMSAGNRLLLLPTAGVHGLGQRLEALEHQFDPPAQEFTGSCTLKQPLIDVFDAGFEPTQPLVLSTPQQSTLSIIVTRFASRWAFIFSIVFGRPRFPVVAVSGVVALVNQRRLQRVRRAHRLRPRGIHARP